MGHESKILLSKGHSSVGTPRVALGSNFWTNAILLMVLIGITSLSSIVAWADSEDTDDDVMTTISVPDDYLGLVLEFGDESIGLSSSMIEVASTEATEDITLRAADGRILSRDRGIVDGNVFEQLEPKRFRLAFEMGESRWHQAGKMEELLVESWSGVWGVDVSWTPPKLGPFGFQLGQYVLNARRKILPDLTAQLSGSKTRLGIFWERVATKSHGTNLHNIHIQLAAGASLTNWWYEVADNVTQLEEKARTFGPWTSVTASLPIIENSWVGMGLELAKDPLQLDQFEFQTAGTSTRWYLRVAYAF